MSDRDFDLFTIGGGSGGVAASRRAGSYGAKVALAEESRVGGTCVIRGCVPKKLLVYGSSFATDFADAVGFGWSLEPPVHDWAKLIQAKNREVDRLESVYGRLLRDAGVTVLSGRARIVDPHTVEVGGQRYTAEHILVATGARPLLPRVRGVEHAITSNELLELPALPKRLVVAGGGYIGVELAGVMRSLGVEVTMVVRGDTILRGFDEDIRAALTSELRKRGIVIRGESLVADIEKKGEGLSIMLEMGELLEADAVLFAIGRVPATKDLGLAEVGVELDEVGAVVVDELSTTRVPNIHAVGDCTNRLNLTPVAIAEGRALVETLFRGRRMVVDHETVPTAVFSQPPAAAVGMTEHHARAVVGDIDVYVTRFRGMRHTLGGRDERTMMKLVVDRKTDRVLGCHMVGADAPEIMQGVAIALKAGATKADFDLTVGIHPTAAEELVTMRDKRPDHPPPGEKIVAQD